MRRQRKDSIIFVIAIIILTIGSHSCKKHTQHPENSMDIDKRSYNLGVIGAFSEVVALGIKKLALSTPLAPKEMAQLIPEAERIARDNGALIHLEKDFLITDLFPAEITKNKHVLLIYLDSVKEEYLALKVEKDELIKTGQYHGEARKDIARKMGRLLSYPEDRIEKMLAEGNK